MNFKMVVHGLQNHDIYDKKLLSNFKKLFLNYQHRNTLFEIIRRTRDYEYGLLLCDRFDYILEIHKHSLSNKSYENIDQDIIGLRLMCLDKSDRWFGYLDYFERVFLEKKYEMTYSLDCDTERFGRYYRRSDYHLHYIHFLYNDDDRREIIQRKADRQVDGKSTTHLKHRPQSELTDNEIYSRYYEVLKRADSR